MRTRCTWDGPDAPCDRLNEARGLCRMHYQRAVTHGLPMRPARDDGPGPLICDCDTPNPQPAHVGGFRITTTTECSTCRRYIP
jgi:hypothetical protein